MQKKPNTWDIADRMSGIFAKVISAALDMENPFFWTAVDNLAGWKFHPWPKDDIRGMLKHLRGETRGMRTCAATEVVAWGMAHPTFFHRLFAFTTASQEWSRWACATANGKET